MRHGHYQLKKVMEVIKALSQGDKVLAKESLQVKILIDALKDCSINESPHKAA